jgi:hypothetical protein
VLFLPLEGRFVMKNEFEVIVTQNFEPAVEYTGLTQEQLDWLLSNFFWIGVSYEPGYLKLTFYLPLPPQEEMTEE